MGDVFGAIWKVAGTLGLISVAAAALRGRVLRWWRRRPSVRHPDLTRRLGHLRVGQTLEAFTAHLGERPEFSGRDGAGLHYVFHLGSEASVVAYVNADRNVTRFAVSVTSPEFHPTISLNSPQARPSLAVCLGVTTFAELGDPTALDGSLGASYYDYRELHYLGKPGDYLDFVVSHDVYSPVGSPSELIDALHEVEFCEADRSRFGDHPALLQTPMAAARRATPITRYEVFLSLGDDGWPGSQVG